MIVPQNTDDNFMVASQIACNIEGEWQAIDQYYLLLQWLDAFDDEQGVEIVREIISDEKNHAKLLRQLVSKYDKNIPVAKD